MPSISFTCRLTIKIPRSVRNEPYYAIVLNISQNSFCKRGEVCDIPAIQSGKWLLWEDTRIIVDSFAQLLNGLLMTSFLRYGDEKDAKMLIAEPSNDVKPWSWQSRLRVNRCGDISYGFCVVVSDLDSLSSGIIYAREYESGKEIIIKTREEYIRLFCKEFCSLFHILTKRVRVFF